MDDKDTEALMKYLRCEISFSDWLESGITISEDADAVSASGSVSNAHESSSDSTGTRQSRSTQETHTQESHDTPQSLSSSPRAGQDLPVKMTDLLLRNPVAERTRKCGGTSVDEFMKEIPSLNATRKERRKGYELPQHFRREMGQANIFCARGEYENAKSMCMEIIRQVPKCAEPFQTLGMIYEEQGDKEKALQFFLITAYLRKSGDVDEWLKLAAMSIEQNDYTQALTCYNQAIKLEPENVSAHWDRAALCYEIKDAKKAIEYYEMLLKIFPDDAGDKFFELAIEMAGLYHEHDCREKAVSILEQAFSRHPSNATEQAVNVLAEMYISSQHFGQALMVICEHCHIIENTAASPDRSAGEPLSSFSSLMKISEDELGDSSDQGETDMSSSARKLPRYSKWEIPSDIPVDLRVKVAVCMIHLHTGPVKELVSPLFMMDAEDVGDLYLDIAEAYIENGSYEEALPILDSLVGTQKFNQAGVWLRKAECLNSLGKLDEAVMAYSRVVVMAPNHLDARLALASLHQQLGQHDQAIEVLSDRTEERCAPVLMEANYDVDASTCMPQEVEEESTAVQPQEYRLLFHKCSILHAQSRVAEFQESGLHLFSLLFEDVFHRQDLEKIAIHSRRYQTKCLKGPDPGEETHRSAGASSILQDTGMRMEEWWEMFKKVAISLSRVRRHADAEHIILCAMTSSRFPPYESYVKELEIMCVSALFLTQKYRIAFDCLKLVIARSPNNNVVWNMFARITAKTLDVRHHRYCIRLLLKNPDSLPLILSSGNNAFISGTYKFAIGEYVRAFRHNPTNPLMSLLLAIQYIHLACQKFPRSRHSCIVQCFIFLFQYMGLRGKCQEVYYNLGRAFHQIGLLQFALYYYNKVLDSPPHGIGAASSDGHVQYSEKHDLHREAAFNLSLIYKASGNSLLAAEVRSKYLWI